MSPEFHVDHLLEDYASGRAVPTDILQEVIRRIENGPQIIWNARNSAEQVMARAQTVMESARRFASLSSAIRAMPLYGIPFAVKDNIDTAGLPTTAGCPDYSYDPEESAYVVQRLEAAGAILIGKTHMDQFATGLTGTRSPSGPCENAYDPEYISGGSSSGSALAVALGQVSFSLGTDTAGSGRVPAAFNNIYGLKPSRGLVSTRGVVPACRSLDCVSIFAGNAKGAKLVLDTIAKFDPEDAYSRRIHQSDPGTSPKRSLGIPVSSALELDSEYTDCWKNAVQFLDSIEIETVEVDIGPLLEAARLLYEGPWIAERYAAVGRFIEEHSDWVLDVTRKIILGGREVEGAKCFEAMYRLEELRRKSERIFEGLDAMVLPTTPGIYTIAAVQADPVALNSRLGTYTNFMNLLDLCGLAIPAGFTTDGLPFGITLIAPAGCDQRLLAIANQLKESLTMSTSKSYSLMVCGAHMSGMALNHELTDRNAKLAKKTATAAKYRFYALPGEGVIRPGLVRVPDGESDKGASIDVEVWDLPADRWGDFIAGIPAPLCIGSVELEDGTWVKGFLCEAQAVQTKDAKEITSLGSWRVFMQQ
ncbi:MAG TPA: allophanate hydrolase [Leptospiraceae bacterium]|nr:allophanate hydrolase [Spirochaetaceae bacterium]HBS06237.1 allophanate hydrolase [Leptospiraceae bacterium]|tara:strand:- start:1999 stop:3768 length:1770 start_codon:yes stop_codon:yes gene_type:complete